MNFLYGDQEIFHDNLFFTIMFTIKNVHFYQYRQISLETHILLIVLLIYRGHEQLKPIYDNVSGTSKNELSQFGHQIHNVFSNIAIVSGKGS